MLTTTQILGALSSGMIYALVAFAVFISFRVLDFPDLTVDGSFPLGAAVAAVLISSGVNPWAASFAGFAAGMAAGALTALLHVKLNIMNLLASILVMTALYSVNLRIMGKPNIPLFGQTTILSVWEGLIEDFRFIPVILFAAVIATTLCAVWWFMKSEVGLAMRATGANPEMARAQGIATGNMIILGIAVSNGLVGFAGALMAQNQQYADAQMGVGTIVIGLAALIGGEALLEPKNIFRALMACIIGAIMYRLAIALALNAAFLGLKAQDLNLITAVIVTLAIVLSDARRHFSSQRKGRKNS